MHKANRSQFQISNFEFEIQNPVPSRSLRVSLGVLCVFSFVESQRTQVRATARVEAEREPPRQPKRLPPLLRKEGSFSSAIHHSPFTIYIFSKTERPARPSCHHSQTPAPFEAQTAQNDTFRTKRIKPHDLHDLHDLSEPSAAGADLWSRSPHPKTASAGWVRSLRWAFVVCRKGDPRRVL